MKYFKETDDTFVCQKCKRDFKSYHYFEDCSNCIDGETDDGETCPVCGGIGDYEEIVKDHCQMCLYNYLTRDTR